MKLRPIAALCVTVAVLGCGPRDAAEISSVEPELSPRVSLLTGYHVYDERHGDKVFALGIDGPICLVASPANTSDFVHASDDVITYFEATGRISARGRFGLLGQCPYVFEIDSVVVDRALTVEERALLPRLGNSMLATPPGGTPSPAEDPIVREN